MFTDRSGKTFRIFGSYRPEPVGPFKFPHDPALYAGKPSDDGHVYVGGFTVRMNPDGTNAEIIGYNYRNSYEQSVTSLGDVFQNDNDDPPACRVSWVMEYANFGFSSNDGQRTWQADRRPGQSIPVAEWRQDDPGMMPAGDVYGGGSPTGNVFYENGALGPSWEGTFLAADAGRNEVFSYKPARQGAGFALDRKIFLTSNVKQQYAGSDFIGGARPPRAPSRRCSGRRTSPSVPTARCMSATGSTQRVGGHQDLDDTLSGAIYRIAPKGFVSKVPAFDAATIDGQITALRSPAVNVRAIGFEGLKARGASAVNAVAAVLNDPSPYMRGRAIYLLYQLGPEGRQARGNARVVRRSGAAHRGLPGHAARGSRRHCRWPPRSPATRTPASGARWRCRCATSRPPSRWTSWSTSRAASTGRIAAIWKRWARAPPARSRRSTSGCTRELGVKDDPIAWSATFTWLAWRLHVPAAVPDLSARAQSSKLSLADRRFALDTLAFINDPAASKAMLSLAEPDSPLREPATCVAVEPHVQRLGGPWPAAGAQGGRDLRSRLDHAARGRSCRRRRRISRSSRSTRSPASPETPHAGRTRPRAA